MYAVPVYIEQGIHSNPQTIQKFLFSFIHIVCPDDAYIFREHLGAGTKAVEMVVKLGAGKVISGDFGPKAKELLEKLNIQMVLLSDDSKSIADIIDGIK